MFVGTSGTDFSGWTRVEIVAYLDRKGEDYDDCGSLEELVQRARECEVNCGETATKPEDDDHEEDDPLDIFMNVMNDTLRRQGHGDWDGKSKGEMMVEDDPGTDFLEAVDQQPQLPVMNSNRTVHESDQDRFAILTQSMKKKDHGEESYQNFAKDFIGQSCQVMQDFENIFGNDGKVMMAIRRAGFERPTQIQAQAIPQICMGKDCMGIAETGSGKTMAFVLPMIMHVKAQTRPLKGEGPIAVVLAPTRELAEQIHKETRKFGSKTHNLKSCAAFGGLDKYSQVKELKAGVDIVVATPGRLLDLVKGKACNLSRVTYLVIDEADRMLDLGFEPQIQAVVLQIRPDRQMVMFSATMPKKVQRLANRLLKNPSRIKINNETKIKIRQYVHVTNTLEEKKAWLMNRIEGFVDQGNVIIFVNQKSSVEDLFLFLSPKVARVGMLHGDMDQGTRMKRMSEFKSGEMHVLIATDIAARGLDIDTIQVVINFDSPKDVNAYIHRIGRTNRSGRKDGEAFSLLLPNEQKQAAFLVEYLEECGIQAPQYVSQLASKHRKRKSDIWSSDTGKHSHKKAHNEGNTKNAVAMPGFTLAPSVDSQSVGGIPSFKSKETVIIPPQSCDDKIKMKTKKSRWDT